MTHQRLIVFAICAWLLVGCSVPSIGALTPEQTAQQMASGPGGKAGPMQMLGRRTLPNGTVIVLHRSTHTEPDGQQIATLGYTVVERDGLQWQPNNSAGFGGTKPPASEFVWYSDGLANDRQEDFPIVWGEPLALEVLAVEARFSDGESMRDDLASGVFAFARTTAFSVCELRVLGEADVELRKITIDPSCPKQ